MAPLALVHGFGQKASSWEGVVSHLKRKEGIYFPELSDLLKGASPTYDNLFSAFSEYCDSIEGPLDICGLSLGGILALRMAIERQKKANSLVLIATPHKVNKALMAFQSAIFRLLPESAFESAGFGKAGARLLFKSMKNLDFTKTVKSVSCPTLVLCGTKDKANRKAALFFKDAIKGAELEFLEGGHGLNADSPEMLADSLNLFYGR